MITVQIDDNPPRQFPTPFAALVAVGEIASPEEVNRFVVHTARQINAARPHVERPITDFTEAVPATPRFKAGDVAAVEYRLKGRRLATGLTMTVPPGTRVKVVSVAAPVRWAFPHDPLYVVELPTGENIHVEQSFLSTEVVK